MTRKALSKPVWFNPEAQDLHRILKDKGIISKSFNAFVKDAFHDSIDSVNQKLLEMRNNTS